MDSEKQRQSGFVAKSGRRVGFVMCRHSAEIHSDYTQTGQVDFSNDERTARTRRPGSILLPVLDPDAVRTDLASNDSANYLTPVYLRPSTSQSLQAGDDLVLTVRDADQHRMAGYRKSGDTWQKELGGSLSPRSEISVPADWTGEHLRMCALTLAGDPRAPAPPASEPPTDSSHKTTRPGEVWLELHHRKDSQTQKADAALCLIAPFLLQSNLAPAHRLYVASSRDTHNFVYDVMEACWKAFGAEGEFSRASHRPFSPSTPEERDNRAGSVGIHHNDAPLLSPDKMYLVDGTQYPDAWIQDRIEIGYCSAPGGRAFNIVLDCKGQKPGKQSTPPDFVDEQIASRQDRVFAFKGISEPASSFDYGGNIAVSPPVKGKTNPHNDLQAGPPVPKHPAAPHGKIVLGDCYNPHRKDGSSVHDQMRNFLRAQGMQPIIPIDTSWLEVGHVDEIMTFVPGRDRPKLGMARPDVMNKLLDRTRQFSVQQGRTHFHRGRHKDPENYFNQLPKIRTAQEEHRRPEQNRKFDTFKEQEEDVRSGIAENYDERSVEEVLTLEALNNEIRDRFLNPIEGRLCHCTGLKRRKDVLPLPVYFECPTPTNVNSKWGKKLATACTPNVVNMQVLNTEHGTHLLVPRPCGPRLPTGDARNIVEKVLKNIGRGDIRVPTPENGSGTPGFPFWAWPDLHADTLALFFTYRKGPDFLTEGERKKIIDVIKRQSPFEHLDSSLQDAFRETRKTIIDKNANAREVLNEHGRFTEWYRLFIPEETVDVIELYTRSVLESIGCDVHFVDAWQHHIGQGAVHCATDVLHRPPTAESLRQNNRKPWWNHYRDLTADNVNTTYDPHNTAHK